MTSRKGSKIKLQIWRSTLSTGSASLFKSNPKKRVKFQNLLSTRSNNCSLFSRNYSMMETYKSGTVWPGTFSKWNWSSVMSFLHPFNQRWTRTWQVRSLTKREVLRQARSKSLQKRSSLKWPKALFQPTSRKNNKKWWKLKLYRKSKKLSSKKSSKSHNLYCKSSRSPRSMKAVES